LVGSTGSGVADFAGWSGFVDSRDGDSGLSHVAYEVVEGYRFRNVA